jgi:N-acetyl-1-D-myo-inositol-2-amino-2-deoxy-alpha-D-glucopyranoside deacetylase
MKVLLTVAHPDDEAFGCGSILADAVARGATTVVACATRGELGELAPAAGLPHDLDPDGLGAVREAELREACALLGVSRVEVLDWRDSGTDGDPPPGSLVAEDPLVVARRVAQLVDEVCPDVVVTIDQHDHRDHAAISRATLVAIDLARHRPTRVYVWCLSRELLAEYTGDPSIDVGTPDADATTVVDTSAHLDLRWRAIRTHRSQTPPFDGMSESLQLSFLGTDRLRRVVPPWGGGDVVEHDWLPTHISTHRGDGPP